MGIGISTILSRSTLSGRRAPIIVIRFIVGSGDAAAYFFTTSNPFA
jgi:hypothetical protein